jgi:hypothetical protein
LNEKLWVEPVVSFPNGSFVAVIILCFALVTGLSAGVMLLEAF